MAIEWYYRSEDGREVGPVNSSQLKRLADSGRLAPASQVRLSNGSTWEPASQVDGLFPAGSAAPGSPAVSSPAPIMPPSRAASASAQPAPAQAPAHPAPAPLAPAQPSGMSPPPVPASPAPPAYAQPLAYQPAAPQAPVHSHPHQAPVSAAPYGPAGYPTSIAAPVREWYCQVPGNTLGPLRVEELRDLARLGRVQPTSPVSRGPHGPWAPAVQLAAALGLGWPHQAISAIVEPEPAPEVPLVAPAYRSPAASLPRGNSVFPILFTGFVAIAILGVAVASYIVINGREILAEAKRDSARPDSARPDMHYDAPSVEPAHPDRSPPPDEVPSSTGLNHRPKERGDRFQNFALRAAETKWVGEVDAVTKADIAAREKRVASSIVELSKDFVTEPLEAEYKRVHTAYHAGNLPPQTYVEALEALQKVLRRPEKGTAP